MDLLIPGPPVTTNIVLATAPNPGRPGMPGFDAVAQAAGRDGPDGEDGRVGLQAQMGVNPANGANGVNSVNQTPLPNTANGANGTDALPGVLTAMTRTITQAESFINLQLSSLFYSKDTANLRRTVGTYGTNVGRTGMYYIEYDVIHNATRIRDPSATITITAGALPPVTSSGGFIIANLGAASTITLTTTADLNTSSVIYNVMLIGNTPQTINTL